MTDTNDRHGKGGNDDEAPELLQRVSELKAAGTRGGTVNGWNRYALTCAQTALRLELCRALL